MGSTIQEPIIMLLPRTMTVVATALACRLELWRMRLRRLFGLRPEGLEFSIAILSFVVGCDWAAEGRTGLGVMLIVGSILALIGYLDDDHRLRSLGALAQICFWAGTGAVLLWHSPAGYVGAVHVGVAAGAVWVHGQMGCEDVRKLYAWWTTLDIPPVEQLSPQITGATLRLRR